MPANAVMDEAVGITAAREVTESSSRDSSTYAAQDSCPRFDVSRASYTYMPAVSSVHTAYCREMQTCNSVANATTAFPSTSADEKVRIVCGIKVGRKERTGECGSR